jgi:phosphatidate cytidylyltransferase
MGRAEGVPVSGCVETNGRGARFALVRRALSAAVLLPLVLWMIVAAPPWVFAGLVLVVGGIGQWEFTRLFRRAGVRVFARLGLVAGVLVTASFAAPDHRLVPAALGATVVAVLAAGLVRRPDEPPAWEPAAVTVLGVLYVNWLLGHALWIRALPDGVGLILLLASVTWVGETTAYLVGSRFGRRRLAPVVSPRKTVEGAVAQLLVSPLAGAASQPWLAPSLGPLSAAAFGLVLGVTGQAGDLVESLLKRSVGAKDAGALLPGHGGILDRVDGLLFNAPFLYYCAVYGRAVPS